MIHRFHRMNTGFFVDTKDVPNEDEATMWFESVVEFLKSTKNAPSLREVHLVDTDACRIEIVKSYFDQCIPK